MIYTAIIIFDVMIPIAATLWFYKSARKYLWCVPIIALIIAGTLFFRDVLSINGNSFESQIKAYFQNDWCIGFYLFYIPATAASLISTCTLYIINFIKMRH